VRPSKKDRHWFRLALNAAESSMCKFQHGAVIVNSGKPISVGVNLPKFRRLDSITYDADFDKEAERRRSRQETTHAEAHCVLKVRGNLRGTTLYSARLRKDGYPGLSKPCASCRQIIELSGITTVVFWDGKLRKLRIEDL